MEEPYLTVPFFPKHPPPGKLMSITKAVPIWVSNVYDPTKLWVVVSVDNLVKWCQELKEYYSQRRRRIPANRIRPNMVCMVRISDCFYRALTLPYLGDDERVKVFLIDLGTFLEVPKKDVFYVCPRHCVQPRFSIRASLRGIAPPNNAQIWSIAEVGFLQNLIENQSCYAIIHCPDFERSYCIDVFIQMEAMHSNVSTIMKWAGFAIPLSEYELTTDENSQYECLTPRPFKLPSFSSIEKGLVPPYFWDFLSNNGIPLHIVFPLEYRLKGEKDENENRNG